MSEFRFIWKALNGDPNIHMLLLTISLWGKSSSILETKPQGKHFLQKWQKFGIAI